jgi:hypothetical protein
VGCGRRGAAPGGRVPTYLLTDNDKTVTVGHVAGIPVRNPAAVQFGRHYGLTVATCVPYDPASKGGSESTVKLAKADLVPTEANLLPEYGSFAELEAACAAFCGQVNARPHRITRRPPAQMLAGERSRLHPVPAVPFTAALDRLAALTAAVAPGIPIIDAGTGPNLGLDGPDQAGSVAKTGPAD